MGVRAPKTLLRSQSTSSYHASVVLPALVNWGLLWNPAVLEGPLGIPCPCSFSLGSLVPKQSPSLSQISKQHKASPSRPELESLSKQPSAILWPRWPSLPRKQKPPVLAGVNTVAKQQDYTWACRTHSSARDLYLLIEMNCCLAY